MEKFHKNIKELSGEYQDSDDDEDENEEVSEKRNGDESHEEFEEWEGFEDDDESSDSKTKGILKRVYASEDNDRTEVTIEDVELNNNIEEIARLNYVNLQKSKQILEESIDRAKKYAVIAGAEPKKSIQKKKKFRYLTKSERRANNRKAIDKKKKSRNRD